jgi:hypothetical protein
MALAYPGLHQLGPPVLDLRQRLPAPQRGALATVFGLSEEPPPDRFVAGLAVLGLLSGIAEERPLVCVIGDPQWLDNASALAVAFVARCLLAESIGLVFAVHEPREARAFSGLPDLVVGGLSERDARALLDWVLLGRLDQRVRDRVVSESRLESLPAPTRRLLLIAAAEPQPTPGRGRYGSMCVPSTALR